MTETQNGHENPQKSNKNTLKWEKQHSIRSKRQRITSSSVQMDKTSLKRARGQKITSIKLAQWAVNEFWYKYATIPLNFASALHNIFFSIITLHCKA